MYTMISEKYYYVLDDFSIICYNTVFGYVLQQKYYSFFIMSILLNFFIQIEFE